MFRFFGWLKQIMHGIEFGDYVGTVTGLQDAFSLHHEIRVYHADASGEGMSRAVALELVVKGGTMYRSLATALTPDSAHLLVQMIHRATGTLGPDAAREEQ